MIGRLLAVKALAHSGRSRVGRIPEKGPGIGWLLCRSIEASKSLQAIQTEEAYTVKLSRQQEDARVRSQLFGILPRSIPWRPWMSLKPSFGRRKTHHCGDRFARGSGLRR